MHFERQAGVFLHLSSLPGDHGIGDIGDGARSFLAFLDRADQSLWQICPTGPTTSAHGHSPYSSPSTFAGNPLFVDLHALGERGWLTEAELEPPEGAARDSVEYDAVSSFKHDRLWRAFERFDEEAPADRPGPDGRATEAASAGDERSFETFRAEESAWLEDYALFSALKAEFDGAPWQEWPAGARNREEHALQGYREDLAERVRFHAFVQWRFDEQWRRLRADATERGISLLGDVPMYVALDSADVWANREAFAIEDGHASVVAGVPPNPGDDGQRWGMPVYDWDHLASTGYDWWVRRLERTFDLVDVARLDHFKAFDEYWAIPGEAEDPASGEWRPGPGVGFFETVGEHLGELPFVVEDLGFLDDGVLGLRDHFDFPGMRVPLYADWCAPSDRYKPADFSRDCVGYTSTHDTDTVVGYYQSMDAEHRDCLEYALDTDGSDVAWSLLEAVWDSPAVVAMTTVQDLLGLGSEARLNTPGTATGNWRWRVREDALTPALADRLADVTGRVRR